MSSFYAELTVDGQTYPVRECQLGVSQATAGRGQVSTQVRPRLVQLILDVPSTDALLMWAATPFRPQAGHITFFQADRLTARETVGFAAGQCVRYRETFVVGDSRTGAYVCQLTIAAEHLTITPGGPAGEYVPAAAREYAAPVAAAATEAEAAVPGPEALTKQQRYDTRMNLMQDSRTKLSTAPDEPAQAALTRLERNNVAVERAKLSAHVYHSDEVPPVEEPEGWHKLTDEEVLERGASPEMLLDPKSGFKSALYTSSFERPPKLVIAFAGTEDKKDMLADLRQGVGREEKQYNEAMDLASAVTARVGARSVEMTGHSLGGGLASAATVVSGAKGYTFNAAGLHVNTVKRAPYDIARAAMREQGSLIDAYRSTSDPLNNAQKAAVLTRGVVLPKALGVDRPVVPAAAWQHKWSELVKGNPLTAAKQMALHGHGISPQMVNHIEHEKDLDTATLTNYLAS